MVRFNRAGVSVIAVMAAVTVTAAMGAPSAGAATRRTVPGSTPQWVAKAHKVGRAAKSTPVSFRVYLTPNGGVDAVKAAVTGVSDPSSASYRKFVSAAQYHARYDATSDSVSTVTRWLQQNHFTVTGVEQHHRYLSVKSTVAAAQSAFKAPINRYRHEGKVVQANEKALTVPAAIAPYILSVSGLDTTPRIVKHHAVAPPQPAFVNGRPCSIYYGQLAAKKQADFKTPLPKFKNKVLPYAVCGYTGPQFRAAYENNSPLTGAGVTVAITDAYASPTILADAKKYSRNHGDGSYASGQFTQVAAKKYTDQEICDASGWYGEETLDVEAVHAMAPGAKIRYYASASCFDNDFLKTLGTVVDENKAQIVSNSWGDLEEAESTDLVGAYESIFMQAALQGISVMFSSGDNGDELANSGLKQADYPSSDPYITAVGGTADAIDSDGSFKFQTGWGTHTYGLSANQKSWVSGGYLYGAGGGTSALFNQPKYQHGVVPSKFGFARAVPDVGLDADPTTGMLIGQTQTFPDGVRYGEYRIGGTSLASPLFAGMTALLLQHAGGSIGFLNPTIYSQATKGTFSDVHGTPSDAGNVRVNYVNSIDASDGLTYLVRTFNQDSSLALTKGWDEVTGVGSPNAKWLTSVSGD